MYSNGGGSSVDDGRLSEVVGRAPTSRGVRRGQRDTVVVRGINDECGGFEMGKQEPVGSKGLVFGIEIVPRQEPLESNGVGVKSNSGMGEVRDRRWSGGVRMGGVGVVLVIVGD